MTSRLIGADEFAACFEELMGEVDDAAMDAAEYGVREGAKATRKEWKARAPRSGYAHSDRKAYADSISLKIDRTGEKPKATVYSKVPGLPHLLEKGHALVGGGKQPAQVHIAPSAEIGFDKAYDSMQERLGELL